jgi:hypothetical protein
MANTSFNAINTVTGTANQIGATTGNDPVFTIANNPIFPGTGMMGVPTGTTGQRVLALGAMRLNTTSGFFECSIDGATWTNLAVGGGGVASVTGTALEIDVSAGVNPVISIDAGYIGQASITTLGTITTGTWHGTVLGGTYGGTGVNNGASTFTIGGNTAFSGAHTFTGTLTGNTAVTFPTAGTLATTAGVINSITGTALQIDVTAGVNPVISIDAGYVGQNSITTLGTIATGVWNGTIVTGTYGGTGVNNGASTITIGGNLTFSGAHTTAITVTNNTTVTLPTTGVLSSTANVQAGTAVYAADSGAANAYVVTLTPIPGSYTAGMIVTFLAANSCTGASTLNVNAIGAKAIKKFATTALAANDILANEIITVVYDGTNFQLLNPPSSAAGGGTVTSVALTATPGVTVTGSPITTNGTLALTVTGQLLSFQILTSGTAATYTKNTSATSILVECLGAGGGGAGSPVASTTYALSGGGGAGGYCRKYITSAAATYTYTIGAAGAGGATGGNNGSAGTASTFSGLSAGGGAGGVAATSGAVTTVTGTGGAGGTSSGGDINFSGAGGGYGVGYSTNGITGFGGNSSWGGGAPAIVVGAVASTSGANATANSGGGGSGGGTVANNATSAGGNGGSGLIVVWEFS